MWIIVVIVALGFGLFAFSPIIYPLFFALPRARKLERENKLKRSIPIYTFIIPPLIWGTLLVGSILLVKRYFMEYQKLYFICLVFILIVMIAQIPMRNKDLEADFKASYKKYLKESE